MRRNSFPTGLSGDSETPIVRATVGKSFDLQCPWKPLENIAWFKEDMSAGYAQMRQVASYDLGVGKPYVIPEYNDRGVTVPAGSQLHIPVVRHTDQATYECIADRVKSCSMHVEVNDADGGQIMRTVLPLVIATIVTLAIIVALVVLWRKQKICNTGTRVPTTVTESEYQNLTHDDVQEQTVHENLTYSMRDSMTSSHAHYESVL